MRSSVSCAIHVAVLISVTVHAAVLVELGSHYTSAPALEPRPAPVHRVMLAAEPADAVKPAAVQKTENDGRAPADNKPKPIIPKPPPRPKPAGQPPAKPQPPAQATAAPAPTKTEAPAPPSTPPFKALARPATPPVAERREDYIQGVLRRIERHKAYPPLARRRRINGSVILTLRIARDGALQSLNCAQGHPLLCRAAVEATRRAGPFPPPPEAIEMLAVDYEMRFRLR